MLGCSFQVQSSKALDVAVVVALLVLQVWVVESRDQPDHVDGGPGGDDGVGAPLGSPALSRQDLSSGVLTGPGVILPANPRVVEGLIGPPVEESHAHGALLPAAGVSGARVEAGQQNPLH